MDCQRLHPIECLTLERRLVRYLRCPTIEAFDQPQDVGLDLLAIHAATRTVGDAELVAEPQVDAAASLPGVALPGREGLHDIGRGQLLVGDDESRCSQDLSCMPRPVRAELSRFDPGRVVDQSSTAVRGDVEEEQNLAMRRALVGIDHAQAGRALAESREVCGPPGAVGGYPREGVR